MMCPKCEEGTIIKIKFRKTGENAFLCDFCEALWFTNRQIAHNTATTLDEYTQGLDREYTLDEVEGKDQEHTSAAYVEFK